MDKRIKVLCVLGAAGWIGAAAVAATGWAPSKDRERIDHAAGVTSVVAGDRHLTVEADFRTPFMADALVGSAGDLAGDLGARLRAGAEDAPADLATVRLVVFAPMVDQLGRETPRAKLLQLDFRAADLVAAAPGKLSPARVLNLSTASWTADRGVLASWCSANWAEAPVFCSRTLSAA